MKYIGKAIGIILVGISSSLAGGRGGNSGFEFLRMEMGARTVAMGGASMATTGDLYGLAYNPAGLNGIHHREITCTYLNYFMDIQSGFIGFGQTVPRAGTIGAGIRYTNYGNFQWRDILAENLGTFTAYDLSFTVAYADSFSAGLSYGASITYARSVIDSYSADALALDLGILYQIPDKGWSFGTGVLNLGRTMKPFMHVREKLPTSYRIGFSKRLEHLPLRVNFDLIKFIQDGNRIVEGLYWAVGGDFTVTERLFLRWGYNSKGREEKMGMGKDRFAGVSFGFGIRLNRYRFDYGFSSSGVIGNLNYFTLSSSL